MGTISEKLSYLLETKSLIRDAIEAKGVGVQDGVPFRQYADLILQILNQTESEYYKAPCIVGAIKKNPYSKYFVVPTGNVIASNTQVKSYPNSTVVPYGTVIVGEYIVTTE